MSVLREDLGFDKDSTVKRGDIISLFINEYHNMDYEISENHPTVED
jgi:hypothetical protein